MTTLPSRRRPLLCALVAAIVMLAAVAVPAGASAASAAVYRHLGAWVDIYDSGVLANPSDATRRMRKYGVETLYVETANYNSNSFPHRAAVGRLVQFAHNRGIYVVAWTLPGHTDAGDDWQKAGAALSFKSPRGDRFDGFALDIESTKVSNIKVRNKRMIALSRKIDGKTAKPLGAITFSPVFINGPWPNFPWKTLMGIYDVFMPMAYSSYHYNSQTQVRSYTKKAVKILRQKTRAKEPIHIIGGIADQMSASEMAGFVQGVRQSSVAGGSVYDYATTASSDWSQLKRIP